MDLNKATRELDFAYQNARESHSTIIHAPEIKAIILDKDVTFRYILLNAILAKHVEPSVHMRALQAGSSLVGAYDARSLCHKVVVPFDKNILLGRLGGSNEPFLNKPAREKEVALDNPTKAFQKLKLLYQVLENLNNCSPIEIREALLHAVYCARQRSPVGSSSLIKVNVDCEILPIVAYKILCDFLNHSYGGQSTVVVTAAVLSVLNPEAEVIAHHVNQAGSEVRQRKYALDDRKRGIGDVDLRQGGQVIAVEVKDKPATVEDVDQAARRAREGGAYQMLFVVGPSGSVRFTHGEVSKISNHYQIYCRSMDLLGMIDFACNTLHTLNLTKIIDDIGNRLDEIRATDDVRARWKELVDGLAGA